MVKFSDWSSDQMRQAHRIACRWVGLEAFDDFNFVNDMGGIYSHLNRETGELMDGFVPRCALA